MPPAHQSIPNESQYLALTTHSSNLQARLVAALDALNELQRYHQAELDEYRAQVDRLHAKAFVFKQRAKKSEMERDTLERNVDRLVEKDPIPVSTPQSSANANPELYSSSVVRHLTTELTAEKRAFAELKRNSEDRIAVLEAQVAHRDAELQKHILRKCDCDIRVLSSGTGGLSSQSRDDAAFAKERLQDALDQSALRNRALEVEVRNLATRMEQTQENISRTNRIPDREPPPTFFQTLNPSLVTLPVREDTGSHKLLSDIDKQLEDLGQQIEGLQTERHNLSALVNADIVKFSDSEDVREDFRGVLLIEDECVRLRKSERALRQELFLLKATATATEHELKEHANRLQRQVDELQNTERDDELASRKQDRIVEHDAHATVRDTVYNVATPFPSQSSSTPPLFAPSAIPDPLPSWAHDSRANPFTSIPPLRPSRPPSAPPLRGRAVAAERLAHLEFELDQAREDVRKKDHSIEVLRSQLDALRFDVNPQGDGG